MEISKFLDSLLPTFYTETATNDLEMALDEFNEHVAPVYLQFKERFNDYKFKSKEALGFERIFINNYELKYTNNFIVAFWDTSLKTIPEKIGICMDLLTKDGAREFVLKEALKAKDINVLQLSEILSFMVRYARRFLNIIVTQEINFLNGHDIRKNLLPAEIKWVSDHWSAFIVGLNFTSKKKQTIKELTDKVPDVLINKANIHEVRATSGNAIDPFGVGFIPVALNPIYHIGMRVAEYQAARYHEAKLEQQALAAKIMYLEKRLADTNDAKLETVIEEYDRLLQKKTYEIHNMEDKYVR